VLAAIDLIYTFGVAACLTMAVGHLVRMGYYFIKSDQEDE
jgi:hypothetical protein